MTRQQFQILVVINQLLAFAGPVAQSLTDHLLPPELHSFLGLDRSVFEDGSSLSGLGDVTHLLRTALMIVHVVASVGLCLGRRWGRTLLALCLFADWLLVPFYPFYIDTSWAVFASYAFGVT